MRVCGHATLLEVAEMGERDRCYSLGSAVRVVVHGHPEGLRGGSRGREAPIRARRYSSA